MIENHFFSTHRREGDVDFFFAAGEGSGDVELNASCEGRTVEIWDAVKCGRARCPHRAASNGKTRVSLDLPIGGSCFIVFAPKGVCENSRVERVERVDVSITNAWQVSFAYHDGISAAPPAAMTMPALRDWMTFGEEGKADSAALRYFSGTAKYRTTFSWRRDGVIAPYHATLATGSLPSGIAHVYVNGADCGVAWCAPWEVDISSAVRKGENEIEIRYANNWHNRLVGDCFLKPEERVTRSTLHYWRHSRKDAADKDRSRRRTRYSGPSADDPLQPSGLLGPVKLLLAK